ncbi:MAG: CBS domain-containing protein [Bdellovibrionia bacterium]
MKHKTVEQVMNPIRKTLGERASLSEAREIMRASCIRHIPVVDFKGVAVGILSDRDIKLASAMPGAKNFTVADAMTPDPYVVPRNEKFETVIAEMSAHKYGSVIVVDDLNRVCGIVTTSDALLSLVNYIKKDEADFFDLT